MLTMAYRTPKEGLKTENSERIDLNVEGQDGSVVPFMIKSHIPLRKLMKAYCEWLRLSMSQTRFQLDGQTVSERGTPAQLEMEVEDTIMCSSSRQEMFPKRRTCHINQKLVPPDKELSIRKPHLFHHILTTKCILCSVPHF